MSSFDKPTSPEEKMIQFLHEMIEESTVEKKRLYIKDTNLTIEPRLMQMKNGVAQVIFILNHELFQEEVTEIVAGVGPTSEEAMKSAAIQFIITVYGIVEQALKEKEGQAVMVSLPNRENHFNLYKGEVRVQGSRKEATPTDYWELLGGELIKRLGNKRIYIIKVYMAKTDKEVMCECRVNGVMYSFLTDVLKQVASTWEVEGKIYSEKQCFVLVQDESTYKPYPLSKKEVEQLVLGSLLLYRQCDNQESYDGLKEKIFRACELAPLAEELFSFIPEIFTEVIFNEATFYDMVVLHKESGDITISKHQLTAYDWIYSIVERTIRAGYFEKEQVDRIIACSASFNCINQALQDGRKLEDLLTGGVAIPIDEDYEIL